MALMGVILNPDDKMFQDEVQVLNGIPREGLEAVLTCGRSDWTDPSSKRKNLRNKGN
jgi:hypothetical protein